MATTPSFQPLAGKVALVTGSAHRVGAGIARTLHAAGAQVAVHYRSSAADAAALVAALNDARPGSALGIEADLLDVARLPRLIETLLAAFGRLDVLVNNASTFYPTPVGEITPAHWDDLLGTNLRAPLFLSQAAAPALRAARGLIVNIADIHGQRPLRHHTTYSIAKAGLVMLTRSLARELAPEVRVNAIAPGPVMWPVGGADEALKAEIVERTALKRLGSPQDVALAARYFAVDAPFVTGQVLAVDGGRSVAW
ncbi:MAG: pteridine reductase [Steroidobacteraceae bacterium]